MIPQSSGLVYYLFLNQRGEDLIRSGRKPPEDMSCGCILLLILLCTLAVMTTLWAFGWFEKHEQKRAPMAPTAWVDGLNSGGYRLYDTYGGKTCWQT